MTCPYCDEEIVEGDPVLDGATQTFHRECLIRAVAGSAAHQLQECSCFGGTREDAPGLTLRQGAIAAYQTFLILNAKADV
jgi:hypothetical protein